MRQQDSTPGVARSLRTLLALLLGGWLLLALQPGWTQVLELHEARFLLSDAQQPPADDAAWQPQPLPDIWTQSRNGIGGIGWYRFDFDLLVVLVLQEVDVVTLGLELERVKDLHVTVD